MLLFLSTDSIRDCTWCSVRLTFVSVLHLIFSLLKTCSCTNACRKTPLPIHFMYLGNKEINCIFKTCCTTFVSFSTKCSLNHIYIFFCSNNTQVFHKSCTEIQISTPIRIKVNSAHAETNPVHDQSMFYTKPVIWIPLRHIPNRQFFLILTVTFYVQ